MQSEILPSFKRPGINTLEVTPMAHAMLLRRSINAEADRAAVHPFNVIMEQRLGATDSAVNALEIKQHYMQRDGIVSDLHGLDDDSFKKIRESVLSQRFDRVYFLGDIGGSVVLAHLQKLFYEGFYNRYRQMVKEGIDENSILTELKEGYIGLIAYEKHLEGYKHKPLEETTEEARLIPDNQIWQGMQKYGNYGHYGHYVSDRSEELISYLSSDVEHYYERFLTLVTEFRMSGTKVYVMQGNWDARLPFDFERNTQTPVALPMGQRRFNAKEYFRKHRIPYYTNLGTVESAESLDILVPFDAVAKAVDEDSGIVTSNKIKSIQKQIKKARKSGKTVSLMAHAVPDWTKHGKLPTGEGEVTQRNLQKLVALLNPDELVYGHEHFMRKGQDGEYLDTNLKFKLHRISNYEVTVGSDQAASELDETPNATVVSFAPKPTEPYNAYSLRETPRWPVRNRKPRGAGGRAAPIHVGREVVPLVKTASEELPTAAIIFPSGRRKAT